MPIVPRRGEGQQVRQVGHRQQRRRRVGQVRARVHVRPGREAEARRGRQHDRGEQHDRGVQAEDRGHPGRRGEGEHQQPARFAVAGLRQAVAEPGEHAVHTGQKGQEQDRGQEAQRREDLDGALPGRGGRDQPEQEREPRRRDRGHRFGPAPRPHDREDQHTGQQRQAGRGRE
jgi:hypothetical protein